MVLVSVLDGLAPFDRDAQAGAVDGLLDVVRSQRVAGEDRLDPALADELCDMRRRAGVDDRRPSHEEHLLAGHSSFADRLGHASEAYGLGLLAGDGRLMKPKRFVSRGRSSGSTRTPAWPTTIGKPGVTCVMGTHRAVPVAGSSSDPAIHLLILNIDPAALVTNLGSLVRRAVEAVGKGARDIGRGGRASSV